MNGFLDGWILSLRRALSLSIWRAHREVSRSSRFRRVGAKAAGRRDCRSAICAFFLALSAKAQTFRAPGFTAVRHIRRYPDKRTVRHSPDPAMYLQTMFRKWRSCRKWWSWCCHALFGVCSSQRMVSISVVVGSVEQQNVGLENSACARSNTAASSRARLRSSGRNVNSTGIPTQRKFTRIALPAEKPSIFAILNFPWDQQLYSRLLPHLSRGVNAIGAPASLPTVQRDSMITVSLNGEFFKGEFDPPAAYRIRSLDRGNVASVGSRSPPEFS